MPKRKRFWNEGGWDGAPHPERLPKDDGVSVGHSTTTALSSVDAAALRLPGPTMPTDPEIRQVLEPLCHGYVTDIFRNVPPPPRLSHYTSPIAAKSILTYRKLWLTSQPSPGDPLEIKWGEDILRDEATKVRALRPFSALNRMLDDPKATLFAKEREMFVACFTTDENQWSRRYPGGASFVFDGTTLSAHSRLTIESHGMIQVCYDEHAIRMDALRFFRMSRAAIEALGVPLEDEMEKLAAQHLMDVGVRAFFCKDPRKWDWEKEWRLVKRKEMAGRLIVDAPPVRRVELSIEAPSSGLVGVVLGPDMTDTDRDEITALAALWPGVVVTSAS